MPSQASTPFRVSRKDLRQMRYKLNSLHNLDKRITIASGNLVVVHVSCGLLSYHTSLKQVDTHSRFNFLRNYIMASAIFNEILPSHHYISVTHIVGTHTTIESDTSQ